MFDQPAGGRITIEGRRRERVFGGQSVGNGHHHRLGLAGQRAAEIVVGIEIAHDKSAAMEKHQQWQIRLFRWPVQACVQFTVRAGHPQVAHLAHRFAGDRRQQVVGELPVLSRIDQTEIGLRDVAKLLENPSDLLIERHGHRPLYRPFGTADWSRPECFGPDAQGPA
ncbi:hypothetical protein D3C78_1320190 [compost metagenome]